jgi:hypothetical protein
LYVALALGVVFIALITSVFLFKDRIIQQFIREANKQLNTPIKVGKIDVSILDHFPNLSIVMTDVYVEDSHAGDYPLLTAAKLSFVMNPFEVYEGIYNIQGLVVEESETNLKINSKGQNNYTVLKETGKGSTGSTVSLELKNVVLKNTKVTYLDLKSKQNLVFTSDQLEASIATAHDVYDINAKGQVKIETVSIEGTSFLSGKSFEIKSDLSYDDIKKSLTINPSILKLETASFSLSGTYTWKEKSLIDLLMKGEDTDIQTILSFLPASVSKNVEKYKSNGDVYFNAKLKGEMAKKTYPSLKIDFGFSDATIFHPGYKTRIEDATMKGHFESKDLSRLSHARISLTDIAGTLNGEPFGGTLHIFDFEDPDVGCEFRGKVDASALQDFYPVTGLSEISGSLYADVSLKGKIRLLKNRSTAQQVSTRGTIDLQNINVLVGDDKVPLKKLSGNLQFSNNDLALSNVAGDFGKTDFVLNGFFKNIITFLLFDDQPIGIETDLKSDFLDLDQLFHLGYATEKSSTQPDYKFDISKNVYLNFNCDIKKLKYKRFQGRKIKGDLLVKNKVAVARNLALETMGGNLTLSGIVDSNNPKAIDVVCTSRLNQINLDSIFYVFENFDQDFITDKHLRGKVTADVNFEMALNENLRMFPETLIADIGAVIQNGQLNNFEPLKKLNKYLDDEGLNKLTFSELKNDIHVENKTIYIPQMQVNSNVTNIKISGTHTFDQRIEYRLITPLRGKKKVNEQEAAQAIENDDTGQTKLFLKITGTTENYRIQFDTEAVKKKIVSDLKKEVKELKDAFRNKETQKKKELELEKDDYFEWSE